MGSQWRVLRRGETWSRLWALRTSLAAEFWTFWSFFKKMCRAAWEERVTIIKPREDKGGHKCFCRVSWKKMPNCANTAESREGRSADVLYVKFHAHVISDVKTKISGRKRKRYFTVRDRDGGRSGDYFLFCFVFSRGAHSKQWKDFELSGTGHLQSSYKGATEKVHWYSVCFQ